MAAAEARHRFESCSPHRELVDAQVGVHEVGACTVQAWRDACTGETIFNDWSR